MLACYFEHRSQTEVAQHQQHGSRFYRKTHLCTSVHRRACITCFCPRSLSLSLSLNLIHLAHSTSSGIYRAHTVTSTWFWWHSSVGVSGFPRLFCEYAARCVTFIGIRYCPCWIVAFSSYTRNTSQLSILKPSLRQKIGTSGKELSVGTMGLD